MYIQEKLKMCKFPFKASVQTSLKSAQSLLLKAFQRAIKYWNPMTGSRSKYRFSQGIGNIRQLGSMPEDSGIRYKMPAFSLKWGECVS